MELREVGAGRKEIAVRGEANVSKGDHKALERLRDVILVGATQPAGRWARQRPRRGTTQALM